MNRSIWPVNADTDLIAPLLSRYPNHRKIGEFGLHFFSAWLSDLTSASDYDFIDLSQDELTGEQIYIRLVDEITNNGFTGEIRINRAQADLLNAYHTAQFPELYSEGA